MRYGKTLALDKVSFKAEKGKILGLLGPNGAGKTTLMRILTTYLYPSEGKALVEGYDIIKEPLSVRNLIGYMPEIVPLYDDMIVDEYLAFIGQARGLFGDRLIKRLQWVKGTCGITSIWKHPISEISRGFRQRVGLAQALIHNPKVLILDEPTTGLDPLQIIGIRELIRKLSQDKTILFSTHILQEVEALADRIVILNNGKIVVDGTKQEIIQMATKRERVTLIVKAKKEDVESALNNEDAVGELHFGGLVGEGYVKFLVSAKVGESLVPMLNRVIEENGWDFRELKHEEPTLEEAFIWLLSRDRKEYQ
jgi:ABC-2 type transport system ATP-binding protein